MKVRANGTILKGSKREKSFPIVFCESQFVSKTKEERRTVHPPQFLVQVFPSLSREPSIFVFDESHRTTHTILSLRNERASEKSKKRGVTQGSHTCKCFPRESK